MITLRAIVLLPCFVALSGCAAGIVGLVCEGNRSPQDMSAVSYEAAIEVSQSVGKSRHVQSFECRPRGYYCGGGDWHAQFPPSDHSGFVFTAATGELSVPLPNCPQPGEVGTEWVEVSSQPVASLYVGEDQYRFNDHELRQSSALAIAGVRVESYLIRRVDAPH
jgi:hypothetical protein